MTTPRLVVVFAALGLALGACPGRNEASRDAGAVAPAGFAGPIVLDDENVRALSPESLPAAPAACAPPALVIVTRALDGDTVLVQRVDDLAELRVRLIGVDAPEISHDGTPAGCHSAESTALTAQLVGHSVWLTYDADCQDDFDRELAYVWIGGSQGDDTASDMWNRHLLRRGLARTLTIAPNDAFASTFASDRVAAEAAGTGLWSACR